MKALYLFVLSHFRTANRFPLRLEMLYPYRIYYRLVSGEILILHIRHTARKELEKGEV
jgi:plasmid stabilization system protein ParE